MTTPLEAAAFAHIATATPADDLRTYLRNARGRSPVVHLAAFERLVRVSSDEHGDAVAETCWRIPQC